VLVIDTEVSSEAQKVLTGDTLFIGDVGRPDLAGAKGYTSEMMAAMMYDSLRDKLLKLSDEVEIYPAHGAGSMCGRNISKETSSTIGQQRKFNYALQPMSKEEFVVMMTKDLPPAPAYFSRDAEYNRTGAPALAEIPAPAALSPAEVNELVRQNHLALDVRAAAEYGAEHIAGALNIGLGGQFASWAGALIDAGTPLIIIAEDETKVDEAAMRLARVGLESVVGYLSGGMRAWREADFETAAIKQISVDELKELLEREQDLQVLDVRRPTEYSDGHVPRAVSIPLGMELEKQASQLQRDRTTAVICAGGYRSSAATSLLEQHGFHHLLNVAGGTSAWVKAGHPVNKKRS
jgi:hydroxyacylglutathione hydrolase